MKFKTAYWLTSSFIISLFILMPYQVSAQIKEWNDLDGKDTGLPPDAPGNTCLVNGVPTLKCLEVVTGNLLLMTNALILLVIFVMFVIGSYKYLLSLGDPGKVEDAKKTFTWAVIGLVVYVSAYLILFTIDQLFLGGKGDIFQLKIGE
ncbi:hypothetical protein IPM65_02075 [Candidatus Roizmanbacteria bacterium]|nr:MAG: hypothetical protein IPM65_02075 [Candidatus Roizmanbacteria bacterium]